MDPEQVRRDSDGVMRCRQCGFAYSLAPTQLIERVKDGMAAVGNAVTQTPVERRGMRPRPDVWSVNAYAAHLADAAGVIVWRVRAIATEDNPYLPYHQQDEAASEGNYDMKDADGSVARLQDHVHGFLDLVQGLPETAWNRIGTHQEAGTVRLSDIAHDMGHELNHHAADIREIGASATP